MAFENSHVVKEISRPDSQAIKKCRYCQHYAEATGRRTFILPGNNLFKSILPQWKTLIISTLNKQDNLKSPFLPQKTGGGKLGKGAKMRIFIEKK